MHFDSDSFRREFVDYDFDSILTQRLPKDAEQFQKFKGEYTAQAQENHRRYDAVYTEWRELENNQHVHIGNRVTYTYIDEIRKDKLRQECKDILMEQRRRHLEFVRYAQNFNSEATTPTNKPKTFFQKLVEPLENRRNKKKRASSVRSQSSN